MDSKINKSERQEKRQLGTGDKERERLGKRGKVRGKECKKTAIFLQQNQKQTMGSVHFFNIYNYNNNNVNNNNSNNNHNCSNNNNNN